MRLIESKAELLQQEEGLNGLYKQIEKCARTCYKSENKITEDSAKPFVDRMIKSHHEAVLEHGTVYLKLPVDYSDTNYNELETRYETNPYSKIAYDGGMAYITSNYRVLVENNWLSDLKYLCEPNEYHNRRYTFKLITSIGVTRELNRHRKHSIAEMSTRYCNFSKDKFGNEINFCIPSWWNTDEKDANDFYSCLLAGAEPLEEAKQYEEFVLELKASEINYMMLINKYKWTPQQARETLPLCTASEIIHTAFSSDWRVFFDLRLFGKTGKPHPNMVLLTTKMKEAAKKAGVWEDIMN